MKIYIIETGTFKLDGGASFGIIPKSMWEKMYPADEKNLCIFTLRHLIIETDNRFILIDTGIGNKQDDNFFRHYHRQGHHSILQAVTDAGIEPSQITDVVLTHLHFDHVGGAVIRTDGNLIPSFPHARYHVSQKQWDWANINPNQREKASFLAENITPLAQHKVLNFIKKDTELVPGVSLRLFDGHTDGLLVPFIKYGNKTLVFTSDLIALAPQIPASWVCGYDSRPLIAIEERNTFLNEAVKNNYYLIFQHDYYTEACTLLETEKGIKAGTLLKLEEIL